jgi:hypothetical protein
MLIDNGFVPCVLLMLPTSFPRVVALSACCFGGGALAQRESSGTNSWMPDYYLGHDVVMENKNRMSLRTSGFLFNLGSRYAVFLRRM